MIRRASVVVAALVLAGLAAYASWTRDSCTIGVGGTQASVTFRGWGSGGTCHDLVTGAANGAVARLSADRLGLREAAPAGEVVCSGVRGTVVWTVRDQGLFDLAGHGLCAILERPG